MDAIPTSESVLFWEGDTGGIDNLQNEFNAWVSSFYFDSSLDLHWFIF